LDLLTIVTSLYKNIVNFTIIRFLYTL
jgi:hypothetical protein